MSKNNSLEVHNEREAENILLKYIINWKLIVGDLIIRTLQNGPCTA